jgi:hypothetical protein
MNPSPRMAGSLRQRPLQFPATDGRVEPWNSLTERQQQECRQALRHMLVAVACHLRNAIDDHRGSLDQRPEELIND